MSFDPVEPDDNQDPRHSLERILRESGFPAADCGRVSGFFLSLLPSDSPAGDAPAYELDDLSEYCRLLASIRQAVEDDVAAMILMTYVLEKDHTKPVSGERWGRVLKDFAQAGHDMIASLRIVQHVDTTHPSLEHFKPSFSQWDQVVYFFGRRLFESGAVDLRMLLRTSLEDESATGSSWQMGDWKSWELSPRRLRERSVMAPVFWLITLGRDVVRVMADVIQSENNPERVFRMTFGAVCAITEWMTSPVYGYFQGERQFINDWYRSQPSFERSAFRDIQARTEALEHFGFFGGLGLPPDWFERLPAEVRADLLRIEHHFHLLHPPSAEGPILSRALSLRISRMAYREETIGTVEARPPWTEIRKAVAVQCTSELGLLRPLFRNASSPETVAEFQRFEIASIFSDSTALSFQLSPLWHAWKPLLLAFRSLNAPSLTKELSFWDGKISPWATLPSSIVMYFHKWVRQEQRQDENLTEFRNQFGEYCLSALKTHTPRNRNAKDTESGPRERDPIWRYFYVRAARELRNNPGGDGHHILHWASKHDPDEKVREAARTAYPDVVLGERLGDMSPRRAILYAFWWLCQAHMFALNQEVDRDGAQSSRERMVRLTELDKD